MPFGSPRNVHYYVDGIKHWGQGAERILIFANVCSPDVGVIGASSDGSWSNWSLGETYRAAFPLATSGDDTWPVGFGIDFTSQEVIPAKNEYETDTPPVPMMLMMNNEGELMAYSVINTKAVKNKNALEGTTKPESIPVKRPSLSGSKEAESKQASWVPPGFKMPAVSKVSTDPPQAPPPTTATLPVSSRSSAKVDSEAKQSPTIAFPKATGLSSGALETVKAQSLPTTLQVTKVEPPTPAQATSIIEKKFEDLQRIINSELGRLKQQHESLSHAVQQAKVPTAPGQAALANLAQFLADTGNMRNYLARLQADVTISDKELNELRARMVAAEAKRVESQRRMEVIKNPSLMKTLPVRKVGPEMEDLRLQLSTKRQNLERGIRDVSVFLEEHSRKNDHRRRKLESRLRSPDFDTICRTIEYITHSTIAVAESLDAILQRIKTLGPEEISQKKSFLEKGKLPPKTNSFGLYDDDDSDSDFELNEEEITGCDDAAEDTDGGSNYVIVAHPKPTSDGITTLDMADNKRFRDLLRESFEISPRKIVTRKVAKETPLDISAALKQKSEARTAAFARTLASKPPSVAPAVMKSNGQGALKMDNMIASPAQSVPAKEPPASKVPPSEPASLFSVPLLHSESSEVATPSKGPVPRGSDGVKDKLETKISTSSFSFPQFAKYANPVSPPVFTALAKGPTVVKPSDLFGSMEPAHLEFKDTKLEKLLFGVSPNPLVSRPSPSVLVKEPFTSKIPPSQAALPFSVPSSQSESPEAASPTNRPAPEGSNGVEEGTEANIALSFATLATSAKPASLPVSTALGNEPAVSEPSDLPESTEPTPLESKDTKSDKEVVVEKPSPLLNRPSPVGDKDGGEEEDAGMAEDQEDVADEAPKSEDGEGVETSVSDWQEWVMNDDTDASAGDDTVAISHTIKEKALATTANDQDTLCGGIAGLGCMASATNTSSSFSASTPSNTNNMLSFGVNATGAAFGSTVFGSAAPTPPATNTNTSFGAHATSATFGSTGFGSAASAPSASNNTSSFGANAAGATFGSTGFGSAALGPSATNNRSSFGANATGATFGSTGFGSAASAPSASNNTSSFGANAVGATFGSTGFGSAVSAPSASSNTSSFGANAAGATFGSTGFGSAASGPSATNNRSSFGANATGATFGSTGFGSGASAPSALFGSMPGIFAQSTTPAFGAASAGSGIAGFAGTPSGFGTVASPQQLSIFGTQSPGFGQQAASPFGARKPPQSAAFTQYR
ncbi:hypothetical protein SeLEV6574_g07359 [Synchytrium endobioticum]|nr:hypothetical protein SeLEV6574_g07359 [Synchytrium endobioticum]